MYSEMEALAVLKLSVSPRRNNNHGYLEDVDDIALPTPYTSAPTSPRHAFSKDVIEAPLGEVRAAIPFAWEEVPGTPKLESPSELSSSSDETVSDHGSSSPSSSDESSARESSSTTEFEFSTRIGGAPVSAEELFAKGQLVTSLRLPPRLQAVKHLRNSDSSCSDVSISDSFKSYSSPQSSPRLSICGFTKTTDEETTTILGMQERNPRSLSPLRFFNRDSSFSNSSSSSSSSSSNAGSPDSVTIKQLIFPDTAMASNPKPRQVPSKLELSRSNAGSRRAPVDLHAISARKENIGRALFASRFGMLCSCLGMLPESP